MKLFSAQLNVVTESASCFAARQTSDVKKKKPLLNVSSSSYQESVIHSRTTRAVVNFAPRTSHPLLLCAAAVLQNMIAGSLWASPDTWWTRVSVCYSPVGSFTSTASCNKYVSPLQTLKLSLGLKSGR